MVTDILFLIVLTLGLVLGGNALVAWGIGVPPIAVLLWRAIRERL